MPEFNPAESDSISDAFDQGLADTEKGTDSPAETNKTEEEGQEGADPAKKEGDGGKEPDQIDDDGNPVKPEGNEPKIDADNGKYEGDYTKDRFDGLMSQWQKDRAELNRLRSNPAPQPVKKDDAPANNDVELPPELANADEESKQGFKLVIGALQPVLSKLGDKIKADIMDTLNAPLKQENETKTKVQSEVEELKIAGGNLFTNNLKEILKFASDNDYPLGTLKQAFNSWKREQELSGRIKTLTNGKNIIKEVEKEDKKNAQIPKHSKGVSSKIPNFDPERDGNKSWDQIFDEVGNALGEE